MEKIDTIVDFFNTLCPPALASPQDTVGLQIRGRRDEIHTVFGALELNPSLWEKIEDHNPDFLYLHHPPLWKPLSCLDYNDPWSNLLLNLYQKGISVLAHHTNLDAMVGGLADEWLLHMGFDEKPSPIIAWNADDTFKVVTFVPHEHLDKIMHAAFSSGGGKIGQYDKCSFSLEGTGTFRPLEGSRPYSGQHNIMERTSEMRLEIPANKRDLPLLVEAIKAIHPYEEPVIDVYNLKQTDKGNTGLGRLVHLAHPLTPSELSQRVHSYISTAGNPILPYQPCFEENMQLDRLVLCPGSGGSLIKEVVKHKADVFLTGDLSHHQIEALRFQGITVIPIPHSDGERSAMKGVFHRFRQMAHTRGIKINMVFEDEM